VEFRLMGYAAGQPIVWPCPPDWSNPVNETLAWLTDVMQASATAAQQVRQLLDAPRRSFAWQSSADHDERRVVDAIRRQTGVSQFLLPIYPDVQWLTAALAVGADGIDCATGAFDFVEGGQALLWRDVQHWELVTIASIAGGSLAFSAATADAWGPGDRLYPVRKARLLQAPQETQGSDEVSTLQVQAMIDEPCDWPAAWPSSTTYRGVPVMDWRGDESNDPTDEFNRVSGNVDTGTGPIWYYDIPAAPFRLQSQGFKAQSRADYGTLRALLYQLAGRVAQCWVPDWQASVRMSAPITDIGTNLTVAWQGYTVFDFVQVNRRDLRIELYDGAVLYRRITGSADAGDHEVLQLDSALGEAVDPSKVRQINLMSVCAQSSDTVQLQYDTDAATGVTATINWQALANDV
jgi:hypothetical protein